MKIKSLKFKDLCRNLEQPEINILLGARQVGKSTLMAELEVHAKKLGLETISFNLEYPQDLLWFSRSDEEIFNELSSRKNIVIFIDEFHYLKNASKLFKGLYDLKKNIKVIASGSSSIEIHKHLKESLAGRRKIFKIFPLCLEEWKETSISLDEFLLYGGLPGLLSIPKREEKIEYLSQMVQTYLMKDIKGLVKEENVRAFNHLLFYLAEHQGNILPTSNLASEIGVTSKTVENYLEILEQTFIIYSVHSFSQKLSNELKKSRKYYFYDFGIRNSLLKDFSKIEERSDLGAILESATLKELKFLQTANVEIRFWRTKQGDEVDFIWIEDRVPVPIEVKSRVENDRIPAGLIKFMKNYPKSKYGYVINNHVTSDVEIDGKIIKYRKVTEIYDEFRYKE
ncbi:MAG: ATP-binding protein [Bdellovibrionales bacterium]|nr:ATP-binding protein [Bdellovibrionales bacterium]